MDWAKFLADIQAAFESLQAERDALAKELAEYKALPVIELKGDTVVRVIAPDPVL